MFSSSWYRVAELVPRLRSHLEVHRQKFRGGVWYVMQDQQGGRYHRLSPAGYLMLCLMDGRRTVDEIWKMLGDRLGRDQPTQEECISLLAQLHAADLLSGSVPPDLSELDKRARKGEFTHFMMHVRNPLALRLPLLDPDRFLQHTMWLVKPLFGVTGFLLWLALLATGVTLAGMNWAALTGDLADRVLTVQNAFLILLVYPFIKALHELGHAYAIKRWQGEVHEIGLMFLVFMPVPYVDGSSSLAFPEKTRRAIVGGAGIMVELALAAVAMIVWINVEEGWVRAIAFNTMLIGGVSTLFFNGNPLLRFDGYYVLCDLLEIPNLGSRANKYFLYLLQKYVLGLRDVETPVTAAGEKGWFLLYAIASFFYRMTIMIGIALFIATKFFFIGIALAVWPVFSMLILPVAKGLRFLLTSPKLRRNRSRAVTMTAGGLAALAGLLFVLPVPYGTIVEGVVWLPPNAKVRTQTDGIITNILVEPNDHVTAGTPLIRMTNPDLRTQLTILEAQRAELDIRLTASAVTDRVQVQLIRGQIQNIEGAISSLRKSLSDLIIVAPITGQFVLPDADDLEGRYYAKGEELGLVSTVDDPIVRLVVRQQDVDLIRYNTRDVQLRFAGNLEAVRPARLIADAPSAVNRLPDIALSAQHGGKILTDPADGSGLTPLQEVFQFDVTLEGEQVRVPAGLRAYVRFGHGNEPVAWRMLRSARQLLLATLDV
ncbi:PqqD family peptide modification chaperone [Roseibium sp.]|uniref:PqqD family peptide modification chaperone n=1 Tax=Roseibium sp. TaxID=1936156 RepID=UPI003D0F8B0A